jgi:electron transfer flavoprotein beta subunit
LNILVCLKQILDPEIPARDFRIDPEKKQAVRGAADLVVNIFCENALETALQFRDRSGGKITALSCGSEQTEDAIRKALAMKADEAVLITDNADAHPDPLRVARMVAAAIRKLGGFDLILVGRESGDWGMGQTGGLLAEELGVPFIGLVDQIESAGTALRLRRQTDKGYEILEATPPLVASVTNSKDNLPRIPKTRDVMASYRKPLTRWSVEDLGLDADATAAASCELVDLQLPQRNSQCQFIAGDSLDEKVEAFARRVKEIANQVS